MSVRKTPETRTKCLVSGLRCFKSRQMYAEMMASVPEELWLKIKAIVPITWENIPEIQANVPTKLRSGCLSSQTDA